MSKNRTYPPDTKPGVTLVRSQAYKDGMLDGLRAAQALLGVALDLRVALDGVAKIITQVEAYEVARE